MSMKKEKKLYVIDHIIRLSKMAVKTIFFFRKNKLNMNLLWNIEKI